MEASPYFLLQALNQHLPQVTVCGIASVTRAVIIDVGNGTYNLLIESDDISSIAVVPVYTVLK